MKLIILSGPPGSGKTTYANALIDLAVPKSIMKINKDYLRKALAMTGDNRDEHYVRAVQDLLLKTTEKSVILDNTNCKLADIKELILKHGKKFEIEVCLIGETLSLQELFRVNASRNKDEQVPEENITSLFHAFSNVVAHKKELYEIVNASNMAHAKKENKDFSGATYNNYKRDTTKTKAVIVDIDGTLAHMKNRGPFEWDKVDTDVVDHNIKDLLITLAKDGYSLLFVSGRSSECETKTKDWIYRNVGIYPDFLKMRAQNDYRKDSIVKEEIYEKTIKKEYDVRFALDDRDQVVDFWRGIGIKCLQVERGAF